MLAEGTGSLKSPKSFYRSLFALLPVHSLLHDFFNKNDVTFLVQLINFLCLNDPNVIDNMRKLQ